MARRFVGLERGVQFHQVGSDDDPHAGGKAVLALGHPPGSFPGADELAAECERGVSGRESAQVTGDRRLVGLRRCRPCSERIVIDHA